MSVVGPFQLESEIGRGGMGRVLAGVHTRTGLPVAIKTLTPSPSTAHELAFEREAALVASLDHPHIVPVLDYGVAPAHSGLPEGTPFLVMLRATGTLAAHTGRMTWPLARRALLQTLDALAYAHARGVLHCDIKPSNVLVGVRRSLHQGLATPVAGLAVSDFGIAQRMGNTEGPLGGTPGFMAPELSGERSAPLGPWTDLWAVGALGWALLTGGPPEAGVPFVPRCPIPAALPEWLQILLHPDPEQRFGRASLAAAGLPAGDPAPAPVATSLLPPGDQEATIPMGEAALSTLGTPRELPLPESPITAPRDHPVPRDWRRPRPPWPSPVLQDAGLGVWGLRPVPLVGRVEERDRLWSALRDVAEAGRPRLVLLEAPPGQGRSRLLAWVRHRAHEVAGAAVNPPSVLHLSGLAVVTVDDPPDPGAQAHRVAEWLATDAPILVVAALPGRPASWSALHEQATVLPVPPLHDADVEELVRRALRLEPSLVLEVARAAQGSPRAALDQLGEWIADGRLEPAEHGFRLRSSPTSPLPPRHSIDESLASAHAHLDAGRFREAAWAATQAEAAARRLGVGPHTRLRAELDAVALRLDASTRPAPERLRRATRLATRAATEGWPDLHAEAELRLGIWASNQGRPEDGRTHLEHAIELADAARSPRLAATGRLGLGQVSLLLGDPDRARALFDEILDDGSPLARACGHLGHAVLSRRGGDLEAGRDHAEAALTIATDAGLGFEQAKALRALGNAQQSLDPAAAVPVWRQYIELARERGLTSDLPNAWTDLGLSLLRLDQRDEAERALQHAITLLSATPEQLDAIPRLNLAELYLDSDRHREAWLLLAPEAIDIASIGWASLRPQLWALRAAAAAALGLRPDTEAALVGLAGEDPELMNIDPAFSTRLGLARAHCADQGWTELESSLRFG